jgi:hypothetical protein
MKSTRNLIALVATLCLLGAQQAAFAHWAAHLGAPAQVTLESPDAAHAGAAKLARFCAGCAAYAGMDAALPAAGLAPSLEPATGLLPIVAPHTALLAATRHFDSRAPPAVL